MSDFPANLERTSLDSVCIHCGTRSAKEPSFGIIGTVFCVHIRCLAPLVTAVKDGRPLPAPVEMARGSGPWTALAMRERAKLGVAAE